MTKYYQPSFFELLVFLLMISLRGQGHSVVINQSPFSINSSKNKYTDR